MDFKDVTNYYDGISKGYNELYHEEQIKKIKLVAERLPSSGLWLDLGAGDGVLNSFISKNVKLVSFDISFEMLKLNGNTLRVNGVAEKLPFKDSIFDCVCSFTVIQDVKDFSMVIDEVFRVLKNDGVFIVSVLKRSVKFEEIKNKLFSCFAVVDEIDERKDCIFIAINKS